MKNLGFIALCLLLLTACQKDSKSSKGSKPAAKNIILVIGDGMGPQQISLLYYFAKLNTLGIMSEKDFSLRKVANAGKVSMSTTEPTDNIVVDSACSATQLATGIASRPEMIGLDAMGNRQETILEKAKKRGMATGLVSDTRITHATPASFAAHVPNRWMEDEIATQLLENGPDILMSGGANRFVPMGANKQLAAHLTVKSKRRDQRNLIEEARKDKYSILYSKKDLDNFKGEKNSKILGLFTNHNMPNGIWYSKNKERTDRHIPTLLEMSKTSLDVLSKNDKGFFLMIEAGQIDWAGHQNDAGLMLHELMSLNETVNYLHEWVKKNPDTLLVVTADHETGNFAFGYNVLGIPAEESLTGSEFKNQKYQRSMNYAENSVVDSIYQQKMSLKEMWKRFDKLEDSERNSKSLQSLIKNNTGYELSSEKTKEILSLGPNPNYLKWHKYLNRLMIPKVGDFGEFYHDPDVTKICLVGRAIGPKQSVTWGTGGHTATPVQVFSQGPKAALDKIKSFTNHIELGKSLLEILSL